MVNPVTAVITAVASTVISAILIGLAKYALKKIDFSGGIGSIRSKRKDAQSYLDRERDLDQRTVARIRLVLSSAERAIAKMEGLETRMGEETGCFCALPRFYHYTQWLLVLSKTNRKFKILPDPKPVTSETNTVPIVSNSESTTIRVIQSEDPIYGVTGGVIFNPLGSSFPVQPRGHIVQEKEDQSEDPRFHDPRERLPITDPDEVVGLDLLTEEILKELQPRSFNDQKLGVVSIYGMGGIGKSTLAKKVFDKVDNNQFPIKTWINVSHQYNVQNLRKDMLKAIIKISDEKLGKMTDKQVSDKLIRTLEQRYLIVLDDIWETKSWDDIFYLERERHDNITPLKPFFSDKNNASRIILTTRKHNVANHPDHIIFGPHKVETLSDEDSWELLKKKAFSRLPMESTLKTELESLGPGLAKRCEGLPLALVVLGGYLSKNLNYEKWDEMSKSLNWDEIETEKRVFKILALSYDDLPDHLKKCFLYIMAFPEDHIIKSSDLIKIWIAEKDFICPPRGSSKMETIARGYLNQLSERGLVHVVKLCRAHKRIRSIRIHDVLRDWGLERAEEDGSFKVINNSDNATPSDAHIPYCVALHGYWDENLGTSMPHLRTSLGFFLSQQEISSRGLSELYSLHIDRSFKPRIDTNFLRYRMSLRYICIRNFGVLDLPTSIGQLYNLQTLDCGGSTVRSVPNSLWEISTLRHVHLTSAAYTWCSPNKGQGKNLQTLVIGSAVLPDWNDMVEAIEEMKEIVRLHLNFGTSLPSNILSKIKVLGFLEVLKLCHILELTRIPVGTFPLSLVKIVLQCDLLEEDPMPIFWELPKLVVLDLYHNLHLKSMYCCAAGGFPRLKYLKIDNFSILEEWEVDEGAMPNLCHVRLQSCGNLRSFPKQLMDHKQLELLELAGSHQLSSADEENLEKEHKFKVIVARNIMDSRLSDF